MPDDFSIRKNFPYMHGVYLVLNAIPDAFLVMDSPDCVFFAASSLHGNHDLHSTLLDCEGFHRVAHTNATVRNIAMNRTGEIEHILRGIDDSGKANLILFGSKPMANITGIQYDLILRELNPPLKTPYVEIPSGSLLGDWLDGYSETLAAIAEKIELPAPEPAEDNIAIVGYMMDRTEEDHLGNLRELRRILDEGLSKKLVSVWPSNLPIGALADVRRAGTIVSLPYGRKAARTLARRTGARLIETDLPFGLEATEKWILLLADALGAEKQARCFIDSELRSAAMKLEWAVPRFFFGKKIAFCGDPYLLNGFISTAVELGCVVPFAAVFGEKKHLKNVAPVALSPDLHLIFEPKTNAFHEEVNAAASDGELHMIVGNSIFKYICERDSTQNSLFMEFGFPSYSYHALHDSPFLGFRGALNFIGRMLDALSS